MRDYKEFEGKTLDDAIAEACSYYDVPREKLEIEILQDAKGGIFGLMIGGLVSLRPDHDPYLIKVREALKDLETQGIVEIR